MVFDDAFAAVGDDQDVLNTGGDRLLHDILDSGFIDDREHFLGACFGHRQDARTETGRRNDRFFDFHSHSLRLHMKIEKQIAKDLREKFHHEECQRKQRHGNAAFDRQARLVIRGEIPL